MAMHLSPFIKSSPLASVLLLLLCSAVAAQTVEELIIKGDALDKKFKASDAVVIYLAAEKQEPHNVDVLTRIARQYRHMMSDASGDAEKMKLGNAALSYAQRAAALAPNNADAQLSVAISYGRLLPLYGNKEQVQASRKIKDSSERSIRLNPRNDLAWHVLGRWHKGRADVGGAKAAIGSLIYGNLPPGSYEEAVRCFTKAIALNSSRPMHYIELGRTFAAMDDPVQARKYIKKGLSMPNTDKDDPETKQRGRDTLKGL